MTEMEERVARVLALFDLDAASSMYETQLRKATAAAIKAMREPTEAMVIAGDARILEHLNSHEIIRAVPTLAQNCFAAMIDEALK